MEQENKISIIIPCFNEEKNIGPLIEQIKLIKSSLRDELEVILVDDGSKDKTWSEISKVAEEHYQNLEVYGLKLSRNFGQQGAILAGLQRSNGKATIIMDSDLQDPPTVIPELIKKYSEGFDVVHAKRRSRSGESWFKKLTAWAYYRVINSVSETPWEVDCGEYRLISKKVREEICAMQERGRVMRGLVSWVGYRQCSVYFDRPPRHTGKTKFPLSKMLPLAWTGIVSFSMIPLRLLSVTGLILAGTGTLYALTLLGKYILQGTTTTPWAWIITINIALGGIILIGLGIIGEYIARIYTEVRQRPNYIIEKQTS